MRPTCKAGSTGAWRLRSPAPSQYRKLRPRPAATRFTRNAPDKAPPLWHGRQTLHLEAQDQAALLKLAGVLQADGLVLNDLTATVSPGAARAVEDKLTDEALHRVRERAAKVAAAMGLRVARVRTLTIGSVEAPPLPIRAFGVAMAARAAAPVAVPGEATVGVSDHGRSRAFRAAVDFRVIARSAATTQSRDDEIASLRSQ